MLQLLAALYNGWHTQLAWLDMWCEWTTSVYLDRHCTGRSQGLRIVRIQTGGPQSTRTCQGWESPGRRQIIMAAQNKSEWRRDMAKCIHLHLCWINVNSRSYISYCCWICCRAEFPTSPAELNAVFDAIDKKRTGKITYQQFVSVLHNDPSVSIFVTDFIFYTCIGCCTYIGSCVGRVCFAFNSLLCKMFEILLSCLCKNDLSNNRANVCFRLVWIFWHFLHCAFLRHRQPRLCWGVACCLPYCYWLQSYVDFGQSRLSGLSLSAFINSTQKNRIAYQLFIGLKV